MNRMENCGICGASKTQIVGIIGAVLLIVGCFVPLFSVTILGKSLSVTFFSPGFYIYGGALILTALVIIGLFFAKKVQEAQGAGIAVFITILVFFVDAVTGYNAIRDMGVIASFAAGFFSFGYAWIVLLAGAIIVVAAPYVDRLFPAK
jgi:FtsH-binding integral membrane protein